MTTNLSVSASSQEPYPYDPSRYAGRGDRCTVHFTQHFTKGLLVDLDYSGSINFVSRASAQAWIDGVNRNSATGLLNYTLTEWRIV